MFNPFSKIFSKGESPSDAILSEMTEAFVEVMQENAELSRELAIDDVGYERLTGNSDGTLSNAERFNALRMARKFASREGIVRWTMKMYTNYAVGQGFTWSIGEDEKSSSIIEKFWESRFNKRYFSTQGQRKVSNKFMTDGELFWAFFVNNKRNVTVRLLDPLEMVDIAYDKEDADVPRFYKRRARNSGDDFGEKTYRDWDNGTAKGQRVEPGVFFGENRDVTQATEKPTVIFHVTLEGDKRGVSMFYPQLEWVRSHREFMRSRVGIQQALSKFVRKWTTKGGQKQVNALKNQHTSSLATSGSSGRERKPPPPPGSQLVTNEAVDVQNMKQDTGASGAQVDGNTLMMMAGAAVGIYPHYYGAGDAYRLATATAMELPMLRNFEAYQKILIDMYRQIFRYVLAVNGKEDFPLSEIDVLGPDVFPGDSGTDLNNLEKVASMEPGIVETEPFTKRLLNILEFEDTDGLLKEIQKTREEKKKTALAIGVPKSEADEIIPPDPSENEDALESRKVAKVLHDALKEAVKKNQ